MESSFRAFYKKFPYLSIEQLIEFFACFGGLQKHIELDPFKSLEENIKSIYVDNFNLISNLITPTYLLETPYKTLLISTARGDGKIFNIFKRAKLSEATGGALLNDIIELGVLELEYSREDIELDYTKGPIKKELRRYRVQPKVRFIAPFSRFWFGFVEPFRAELSAKKADRFLENFRLHKDRAISLVFEQLANSLLEVIFQDKDPIVSKGSLWDRNSEFDILCYTKSGDIIIGECKFKSRKICKNELTKLKEKTIISKIDADFFALFSKSGFSNELKEMSQRDLLLFDLRDFEKLLS